MYDLLETHRVMLRDAVRNAAFPRAIAAEVTPGAVVLDVGAGTGILSLFAAQACASRVFAVEAGAIAAFARRLVVANDFQDRIVILSGDIRRLSLPSAVDVLVSEWLGTFGI